MDQRQLQDFLAAIERVREENAATPEQARQFLQEEGIYTDSGELTEPYRQDRA